MPSFEKDQPASNVAAVLSDEQFAELKALLQPGFELSSLMLAEYKAKMAAAEPAEPDTATDTK